MGYLLGSSFPKKRRFALFMLAACWAFVNYVTVKASKLGLSIG
jgi:hypothetical protein